MNGPLEIKVCVVGETDVGKTSLCLRYCHGSISENPTSTIGASFLQKRLLVGDIEVMLQIWDTAGQERFRSMAPMYYRGAKAAILVFDLANNETFERIKTWLNDLRSHGDPNVVICLVGNKVDKLAAPSAAGSEYELYAKSINAKYIETSAKDGTNVNEVFEYMIQQVVMMCCASPRISTDVDVLTLGAKYNEEKEPQGCC